MSIRAIEMVKWILRVDEMRAHLNKGFGCFILVCVRKRMYGSLMTFWLNER